MNNPNTIGKQSVAWIKRSVSADPRGALLPLSCHCELAQQAWQSSREQESVFWIAAPALWARNDNNAGHSHCNNNSGVLFIDCRKNDRCSNLELIHPLHQNQLPSAKFVVELPP